MFNIYKESNYQYEYRGLSDWISDIKVDLMSGKYENRSRLQRKLISLEKAKYNLTKNYDNRAKKEIRRQIIY